MGEIGSRRTGPPSSNKLRSMGTFLDGKMNQLILSLVIYKSKLRFLL